MKIRAIIGVFLLVTGYIFGCVFPPTHFLPASEISVTEADEELSKSIEYIEKAINLAEQGQNNKALWTLRNAKVSSDAVLKHVRPYEEANKYLNILISSMNNLVQVMELSKTNNTAKSIEYINKFLSDFSNLENIGAEIAAEYPDIAERLNIEEHMIILKPIKYDMEDFKDEYKRDKTVLPPPLSFEGELKEFKWKDHLGKEWNFKLKISDRRYEKYKNLSHGIGENKDIIKFVTYEDAQIKEIAERLNNTYSDPEDKANCILYFVQSCVPSIPEEDIEYFRYPMETIVEGGDCEDKSILFVSIMKAEGYDVALINFPYHIMGGVALGMELKRVDNPYYVEPSYLFSIKTVAEDELNKGIISEELKNVFEKNNFQLSDNATVTNEEEGRWDIINEEEKFIIRREEKDGELKVYYDPFSEKKKRYYLCETFDKDFNIGTIPKEYKGMKYDVIVIP